MGKKIKVGIDLDNCITADDNSKEFFRIICHLLHPEYEIHIITNRDESGRGDTIKELEELQIQYSHLALTSQKDKYVEQKVINILFENEDEYFLEIPESTTVFKVREDGNFSFSKKKWITSRQNSILIDD
jgi:hypothetical protein